MTSIRIILGEDNPDHQYLLRRALTQAQPDVDLQIASTGHEVIQTLKREPVDCLLLDYNLPDAHADDLLKQLSNEGIQCPVIVLSSSKSQEIVIESVRNGCVDFVPKSDAIVGDHLWKRIQRALTKQARAHDERRQIQRRVERLTVLAETDPLTGLSNRRSLNRLLNGRRLHFDRRGDITCAMLDLDHFKAINDRYGHFVGDQILRTVAQLLRANGKPSDFVSRWGGEEFMILLGSTDVVEGMLWAERLRKQVAATPLGDDAGQSFHVTVSIGLASIDSDRLDAQLFVRADRALYLAKNRGRDQVATWQMVELEEIVDEVATESDLSPEEKLAELQRRSHRLLSTTERQQLLRHSARVAVQAETIGRSIDVDTDTLQRVKFAAMYHDLGKLCIPDKLLAKSGPITQEERCIFQRHVEDGAYIAERLGVDPHIAAAIRCHHAWFDGTAVPAGYTSRGIPIEAMIIGVADALDAMTFDRSYRPGRKMSDAIDELRRCSGTQFSPELVETASSLFGGSAKMHVGAK